MCGKSDLLPLIGLIKQQINENTFYLYPEFVNLAYGFDKFKKNKDIVLPYGSRQSYVLTNSELCKNDLNSFCIVAKPERKRNSTVLDKDKFSYFRDLPNHTLREISAARILSKLAVYNDSKISVGYEEPLGFYESCDGGRVALFKYQPNLENTPTRALRFSEDLRANENGMALYKFFMKLNEDYLMKEEIIGNCYGWLDELASKSSLASRILGLIYKPRFEWHTIRDTISYAKNDRVLRNGIRLNALKKQKQEMFFAIDFADLILCFNGVFDKPETEKEFNYLCVKGGVNKTFITDFEFFKVYEPEHLEFEVDDILFRMFHLEEGFKGSNYIGDSKKIRKNLLKKIGRVSNLLVERVENYLRPTGYFDGEIKQVGPAYPYIEGIDRIELERVLIK